MAKRRPTPPTPAPVDKSPGDVENPVKNPVTTMPGRNGGTLRRGGTNKGGPGRPPDEIRRMFRDDLVEAAPVAKAIANSKDAKDSDRLAAIDLMAKYGLGGVKQVEISGDPDKPVRTTLEVILRREV